MAHRPLRDLVLRAPRLEPSPDGDEGLAGPAGATLDGIHRPDRMPSGVEWSDAPRERLGTNTFQYHRGQRASLPPQRWTADFPVRPAGRVVGVRGLSGGDFREVPGGSRSRRGEPAVRTRSPLTREAFGRPDRASAANGVTARMSLLTGCEPTE